jgi:ATP-binding cassette subfamily F protein uup
MIHFNLIGPGRVGLALAKALIDTGKYTLKSLYHPTEAKKAVTLLTQGNPCSTLQQLQPADITFITTQDTIIESLAIELAETKILKPESLVVHMSGILPSSILVPLKRKGLYIGSMHPLKAFCQKNQPEINAFHDIDCAIEGDKYAIEKLTAIANQLGANAFSITPDVKARYHAAAIMASNYLVTLAAEATTLFEKSGINKQTAHTLCTRLMQTSLDNLKITDTAEQALTGPLKRGDIETIEKHLDAFNTPTTKTVYQTMGLATLPLTENNDAIKGFTKNMSILSLHQVSLNLANNNILNQVNLQIQPKARIALVGRNGAGKSTVLKLLGAVITPDEGIVQKKTNLRIASLIQDVPEDLDKTVYHVLVQQLGSLGQTLSRYHDACQAHETEKMATYQAEIDAENAWAILPRIETIATHLGLTLNTTVNNLSGGMRRRVLLGAALLQDADLLLLDEPTNHLDIQTIEWLETYLKDYTGALVVVTHDRTFLKHTATSILEIDRGKLHLHTCDYETYLDRQEAIRLAETTQNKLFDKRLKDEEAWLRQGIKARRTRNEGRVRQLKAMREAFKARREQTKTATSHQLDVSKSGKLVLEATNLHYQIGQTHLVRDFSCTIMRGDKIGIVGPNGCGKTTLVRLLLGQLKPTSGHVRLGTQLNIAYFDQLRRELNEQQTVMENVADGANFVTINGKSKHVASYLKDFLFTPECFNQPVFSLSGGEKNRLLLARLFAKPINLLIMDEPTNDLDIETLQLLENMLIEYQGTLLLISHDRAFLNQVVSCVFVYENNGHIATHVGSFDDYTRHHQEQITTQKITPPTHKKTEKQASLNPAELREKKQLPKTIERLEASIDAIHLEMADPAFYQQAKAVTEKTAEKLKTLETQLNQAYLRWEYLEQCE